MPKQLYYQTPEIKLLSYLDRMGLAFTASNVVTGVLQACPDSGAIEEFGFAEWNFICNAGDQITVQVDPDISDVRLNFVTPGGGPEDCVDAAGPGSPVSSTLTPTSTGLCLVQVRASDVDVSDNYVLTITSSLPVSDVQNVSNVCTTGSICHPS